MYGETNNDHGYPQIGDHPQGWDSREQTKEYWTQVGNAELKKGLKYHKKCIILKINKALELNRNSRKAKNVVLFMGDGMGFPSVTAGRIQRGQRNGQSGESFRTAMEQLSYAGMSKTYNINYQIPDSAATATAFLCGAKKWFQIFNY